MTATPKTRKAAPKASAPRQCHASEALSGDLLAGCPKRTCEIDVSALQKMSMKELCDLREAIHTIEAVISSINCQPHFGEHMPNGLVDSNTAGDVLDNLSKFLSSYEQAAVNVAIATKPSTVEECRWRSWTILGFETSIAEDLASFAVLAAEAACDKAEADFMRRTRIVDAKKCQCGPYQGVAPPVAPPIPNPGLIARLAPTFFVEPGYFFSTSCAIGPTTFGYDFGSSL
jgi:hypothetical protein